MVYWVCSVDRVLGLKASSLEPFQREGSFWGKCNPPYPLKPKY